MDYGLLSSILHAILVASTPLVFAGLGALIQERAGVLNLGIEGLMIVGALAGFATALSGFPPNFDSVGGAGRSLTGINFFAPRVEIVCKTSRYRACPNAFWPCLSALAGAQYVGQAAPQVDPWAVPVLSRLPIVGHALFSTIHLSICPLFWLS